MKTFVADIIPKIQRFSQKLDNLTLLTNQHWVVLDDLGMAKVIYIFRSNNELIISRNGKVQKGRWEYLGNNSILIDNQNESYLFKHGFFDENILALKVDATNEYALMINENKFDGELNSIEKVTEFLSRLYPESSKMLEGEVVSSDAAFRVIGGSESRTKKDEVEFEQEQLLALGTVILFGLFFIVLIALFSKGCN